MFFKQIFEPKLAQYAYLIGCQKSAEAIVIDPMRDIQLYLDLAKEAGLKITAVTETHIHADFLSGMRQFAAAEGVKIYASDEGGADWKYNWLIDSDYNYQLLKDHDQFKVGEIVFEALHTPGHTPEHIIFKLTDAGGGAGSPMGILSGDFVFVGDVGRPDLLETAAGMKNMMRRSAETLGQSLQMFNEFNPVWQVWPGHGAGSACGKALGAVPMSTVGYELENNAALIAARNPKTFADYILSGQPEPPPYFARMKRDNRDGPAILNNIPEPVPLASQDLKALLRRNDIALIDTRGWKDYRQGHLPGSICAPLTRDFTTVVGCYVEEKTPMYLVIDGINANKAAIDLVHIGLDDTVGFITPKVFADYVSSGGEIDSIKEIEVADLDKCKDDPDAFLLDVRKLSEVEATGMLPGAHNIAHTRLAPRINEIPMGKHIYINCMSGQRSAYACGYLSSHGYSVINVTGGFLAWREYGGRLVSLEHTASSAT